VRDEFTEKTKKVIQDRAGNHCSNPDCGIVTSGPNSDPEKSTKIGVAAHITAASQNGPRYDSNLTIQQRKSAENGIWLCQTCAHFIDTDPETYTTSLLDAWKTQAEKKADDLTKGRSGQLPLKRQQKDEPEKGWSCPFCGTIVGLNYSICLGCNAELVHGLRRIERQETGKIGMAIGLFLSFILFLLLPKWLKLYFAWDIPAFWGLGIYGLIPAALIIVISGFLAIKIIETKYLSKPPRFFKISLR